MSHGSRDVGVLRQESAAASDVHAEVVEAGSPADQGIATEAGDPEEEQRRELLEAVEREANRPPAHASRGDDRLPSQLPGLLDEPRAEGVEAGCVPAT